MKLRYFWNEATGAGYLLTDDGSYAYNSNCPSAFDGSEVLDEMIVSAMVESGKVFDKSGIDVKLQDLHGITTTDCIEVDSRCQPLEG